MLEQTLTFEMLKNGSSIRQSTGNLPDELLQMENTPVQIRGFLYLKPPGTLVLSGEPGLKSCCVASETKIGQQLIVQGDFSDPLPSTSVLLQGRFSTKTIPFMLTDASIQPEPSSFGSASAFILLVTCAIILLFRKFGKQ